MTNEQNGCVQAAISYMKCAKECLEEAGYKESDAALDELNKTIKTAEGDAAQPTRG